MTGGFSDIIAPFLDESHEDLIAHVQCGGERHRILLTENGVRAIDHNYEAEAMAITLAPDLSRCRCMEIVGHVQEGCYSKLPRDLRDRLEHVRRLRRPVVEIPSTHQHGGRLIEGSPVISEAQIALQESIGPLLELLDVGEEFQFSTTVSLVSADAGQVARSYGLGVSGEITANKGQVQIWLRPDWGERVKRHLAVVDGHFVADVFFSVRGMSPHARIVEWELERRKPARFTPTLVTARLARGGDRYHLVHDIPPPARRARLSRLPASLVPLRRRERPSRSRGPALARALATVAKSTPSAAPRLDGLVQWSGMMRAEQLIRDLAGSEIRVGYLCGGPGVGKTHLLRAADAWFARVHPSADRWFGSARELIERRGGPATPSSHGGVLFVDDANDEDPFEREALRRLLAERVDRGWRLIAAGRIPRGVMRDDPPGGRPGRVEVVHPPGYDATVEVLTRDLPTAPRTAIVTVAARFPSDLTRARVALVFCDYAASSLWQRLDREFVVKALDLVDLDPRPVLVGFQSVPVSRHGRFMMPKPYRDSFVHPTYVVAAPGPCLRLVAPVGPAPGSSDQLSLLDDLSAAATTRMRLHRGMFLTLNRPQRFFAGIHYEVVIAGVGDHVELWSPKNWADRNG